GGLTVNNPDNPEYFIDITPGTTVCFDIFVKRNETIPAVEEPQLYKAYIKVIGDQVTVLDSREVYFLVPPVIEDIIFG
ncbi:MAG: hypothetical protein ABIJ56_23570, partial [Pseudomonadota bacterium]